VIPALERHGTRAAVIATALLPLLLIHVRGVAEGVFAALAFGFVLRCALRRDWTAFRQAWVMAAMAYWAWLVFATLLAAPDLQRVASALTWGRLPLAVLALSAWVLAEERARRWLFYGTGIALLWVVLEVWLQLLVGRGLRGFRRWPAGELPGPFTRPRAGPFLVMGMWALLIGTAGGWLASAEVRRRAAGWALLAFALATMVFVGQRIPLVFSVFGLLIAAALLPTLRLPAVAAIITGAAALGLSSVVAPDAFHRLVIQFSSQLARFPESHYGQILARGLEMARQHPLIGLGEAGFQVNCHNPAYHVGWEAGSDGGGAGMCVTHAHNHYLQALTDSGFPGMLIFAVIAVLLLLAAGRGLLRDPKPLRVGLFVATFLPLWPVASSYSFTSLPMAGVWMVMAGWALAEARAAAPPGRG
jgi:O-antigen ligase